MDEIQKDTEEGKRLLTLRNLFRKIKKKKKGRKGVTQHKRCNISCRPRLHNRVETNIAWYLDPAKYFLLTNYPHATKQKSPPTEVHRQVLRPCPQAFRRQQPFETRKRAIFHGLGEHGPRAACKYSRARARAHSTPLGTLNWHKDGEAACGQVRTGLESAVKS